MDKRDNIKQAYYYTDIEPTLENLQENLKICRRLLESVKPS